MNNITSRYVRLGCETTAKLLALSLVVIPTLASAAIVAGRTPATFAVSSTGAASYTIPIWTPPGVGNVQLQLALAYNSRTPNGVIGIGWSLAGFSAISRCNKTWAQDGAPSGVLLSLSDRFCLDGRQLKLVSGTYGQAGSVYATEIEGFSKIEAFSAAGNGPAWFKVTTKNGLIYEYGVTPDGQIKPGGGATIDTWALSKIRDRVGVDGNRITFTYSNDTVNNTFRVASITYPTTANGQGPFYEVLFTYVARPANDIPSSYSAGFLSREPNRLTTITIREYGSPTHTKRYDLLYEQGTATNRSRLSSIQECSAVNCLPATSVTYQNGTSGWSSTIQTTGAQTSTAQAVYPIPIDLNGDGLTDIFYPKVATSSSSRWWYVLANANGYAAPVDTGIVTPNATREIVGDFSGTGQQLLLMEMGGYWTVVNYNLAGGFTTTATNAPINGEYAAVDYDGDGLLDLASVVGTEFRVRRNTTVPPGTVSFAANAETIFNYTGTFLFNGGPSWTTRSDFDGDGRGDLLFTTAKTGMHGITRYDWEILRSNGFGFAATNTTLAGRATPAVPGDWNADGCTDIVNNYKIFISNCAGGFTLAFPAQNISTSAHLAADWDGDGRTDLLYVNSSNNTWYLLRSTGEGYQAAISTGIAAPLGTQWFVFDKDGDGLVDAGFVDTTAQNAIKYRLHNGATLPADLATSFTDGVGLNQSPTYVTITRNNYTKHSLAQFPEQDFQGPLYVVDKFTASDGIGGTYQNQFWYEGARLHVQGRGFEGFDSRRTIDTRDNLWIKEFFARQFPYTGMLFQRNVIQSNGTTPIDTWSSDLEAQDVGTPGYELRKFPFTSFTTELVHEFGGTINGTLIEQIETLYTYGDGFGNPTNIVTSITDKDPGSPFLNSIWQSTVINTFENNVGLNCVGLPLTTSVTSAVTGETTRTRQYSYSNNIGLCRVSQEVIEPNNPPLKVTTTLAFDLSCGNLQSVQVVGSSPTGTPMSPRTTTLNYGSRCQLPETVKNTLEQETDPEYRYDFGALTSISDPNEITTYLQYDDFGRRLREDRPDGTATTWSYTRCATPPCWGAADLRLLVTENWLDTGDVPVNSRQMFYDGLGRLRSDETNRVLGVWTKNVVLYDSLGRVDTKYQPYSSTSNGHFKWTYDGIGRVETAKLFQPSGALDRTTTYQYAGRTKSIIDPLGRTTKQIIDVRNRLRRVIDPLPGGTTEYDYDAFGNLNKIKDAIGAISTGIYNLRGFKTQWADIDRGIWNFTPNSLNELVSWTDAKSQSFSAEYDDLSRLRKRFEPEGMSEWVWGSVATENNIGSLKSKSGYGYLEEYSYDGAGRLTNRQITTDQQYNYDYAYSSIGALDTITYPTSPIPSGQTGSRYKIQYFYSYGAPNQIKDITEASPITLWTLNTANDYSSPLTETLGTLPTSTSVTNTYKAWTNELASVQSGVGLGLQTNRQNLAYEWDKVGNLERRQDLSQGLTEIFTPDALNRLLSSTLNTVPNLTMSYDEAGNIKTKTGVSGTYDYGPATQPGCTYYAHSQPHAVRDAGGVDYCYDQNGNVVKRDGLTQTWASFNLPTVLQATVNGSTYQSQFFYGPDHRRWKQIGTYSNGTETTLYVGGLLEKVTSTYTGLTYWRHYVPTPSRLTAIVSRNSNNSTWTTFALTDHLGSSDALLDGSGAFKVRESFDAFGARRGSNWSSSIQPDWVGIADTSRRGFTFHEMLDNIGLIHMNGRVYDPNAGRFMAVDPVIGNIADSQLVNPYSYVGNRPLSFTDPSGYFPNDPHGGDRRNGFPSICGPGPCGIWQYIEGPHSLGRLIRNVGRFFKDLFGSDPPPPPPATTFPGTSAQNGVNICDPGMSSPSCRGGIAGNANSLVIVAPVIIEAGAATAAACTAYEPCRNSVGAALHLLWELITTPRRLNCAPSGGSCGDASQSDTDDGDQKKPPRISPSDQSVSPPEPPDDGSGGAASIETIDRELSVLRDGRGSGVKLARSTSELESIFGRISSGGRQVQGTTYPGQLVRLPDGTLVGMRGSSTSGGPTIDIFRTNGIQSKIHVPGL